MTSQPPHSTLSLEDLLDYKNELSLKINNCDAFSDLEPSDSTWADFRDALWGKGLQCLRDPLSDDTRSVVRIPEKTPVDLASSVRSRKILVRSEYEETEQAILLANKQYSQAFLVSGHPGIRKTIFLIWILMRRLVLGLPTAIQVDPGYAFLFHEGGTSQFSSLDKKQFYEGFHHSSNPLAKLWVLVDSNVNLIRPSPIFTPGVPFFVVEALSPRIQRFDWADKIKARVFYMKTWTSDEVRQARPLLGIGDGGPYEEEELMDLFEKYGASPRQLALNSRMPDYLYDHVIRKLREMDPPKIRAALGKLDMDPSSHYIIRIEPSLDNRGVAEKTITSQFIFGLLWDRYLKDQTSEMAALYSLSLGSPNMGSVAGWILESRMHQLLRSGRTIQLFPINRSSLGPTNVIYNDYTASNTGNDSNRLELPSSPDCLFETGVQLDLGMYYRPPKVNFPAIDSLFFVEPAGDPSPILLMFQITRNRNEHDANSRGLNAVDGLVPSNTRKWYVVVTPLGVEPKITVAKTYFASRGVDARNVAGTSDLLNVFHCPIPTDRMFLRESELDPGLL